MSNRPPTSNRPSTAKRPVTSGKLIPTVGMVGGGGAAVGGSSLTGYGSRVPVTPQLATAGTRPGSRTSWGPVQGLGLNTAITVADRPMTQHGLGGLKTSTGKTGTQRQVQDKTYFLGLLRTKMSELTREMGSLQRSSEMLQRDQASYNTYDKRAADLANEIKLMQEELADLNTAADKLSTDAQADDVGWEGQQLRERNRRQSVVVEELFVERRRKEAEVATLERELDEEKKLADSLIANMKPEMRDKYSSLKLQNNMLQQQIETTQQEMDILESRKTALESVVAASHIQQEAVSLLEKIRDLEAKRDELTKEERSRETPAQERETLLRQLKEDNQELVTMERHIQELRDQIAKAKDELSRLDDDLEATQSERNQQYLELKKREQMMDNFLESHDTNRETDLERKAALEQGIVAQLERASVGLSHGLQLPTVVDFGSLKDDLAFKETELEKSKSTASGLVQEQQRLVSSLQKMDQLEEKMGKELIVLKEKLSNMKEELVKFENIDDLRSTVALQEKELVERRTYLTSKRAEVTNEVERLQKEYDVLEKQLSENEAHIQLGNLERKWGHLEQNNFAMKQFIVSKQAETNFSPVAKQVMTIAAEYNTLLQGQLAKR